MFFQDSHPLDKYFLKKSYIDSLLWRQYLIQPTPDLTKDNLELLILLPLPPKYSDYKHEMPHPACCIFRRLDFKLIGC